MNYGYFCNRNSLYKDKEAISWPFYLYNGNPHSWKDCLYITYIYIYVYWDGVQFFDIPATCTAYFHSPRESVIALRTRSLCDGCYIYFFNGRHLSPGQGCETVQRVDDIIAGNKKLIYESRHGVLKLFLFLCIESCTIGCLKSYKTINGNWFVKENPPASFILKRRCRMVPISPSCVISSYSVYNKCEIRKLKVVSDYFKWHEPIGSH